MIARQAMATGSDAAAVGEQLARDLAGDGLVVVFVFADWRLDPVMLASTMQRLLPAPVVGCTTVAVVGAIGATAGALGLYGDWLKVGIGVAAELPKQALARSRDAVYRAARALGKKPEALDPARHVALTFVDGSCGHEEAFCIGSAAAVPQLRCVGGSAASDPRMQRQSYVWANGEVLADAGIVVLLETTMPFEAITSSHLVASDVRTVVTAASGRAIDELDGRPAVERLRELLARFGHTLDPTRQPEYSFARFVDGTPYVRSMTHLDGSRIHLASAVEPGHVLRLMQPGDLIGVTRRDLDQAAARLGGKLAAVIAFSCIARHSEANARGLSEGLAQTYAAYPTIGFQSFGEHTGMLLVNHTLTALAIASPGSAGARSTPAGSAK